MMQELKTKWDSFYSQADSLSAKPAPILLENAFLLPQQGTALDLASGFGANSLFLAGRGLVVTAWDISQVALEKLAATAVRQGLTVNTKAQLIESASFKEAGFDVIVVSRFLDRTLTNAIIGALKVGGLLFYQTYTLTKATSKGPNNPTFLLKQGELLQLFGALHVIYYRDNGVFGDLQSGLRNEAQFIGQKNRSCS